MAQRFGRVNRFGLRDDTRIDIVHPTSFKEDDDYPMFGVGHRKSLRRKGRIFD
jgi:hypothetical protein